MALDSPWQRRQEIIIMIFSTDIFKLLLHTCTYSFAVIASRE
jgi:hypothetical protein